MRQRHLLGGGLALATAGVAYAVSTTSSSAAAPEHERAHAPIVIAHRGAGAYRPEETMHAYQLAVEMGAAGLTVSTSTRHRLFGR